MPSYLTYDSGDYSYDSILVDYDGLYIGVGVGAAKKRKRRPNIYEFSKKIVVVGKKQFNISHKIGLRVKVKRELKKRLSIKALFKMSFSRKYSLNSKIQFEYSAKRNCWGKQSLHFHKRKIIKASKECPLEISFKTQGSSAHRLNVYYLFQGQRKHFIQDLRMIQAKRLIDINIQTPLMGKRDLEPILMALKDFLE